MNRVQVRELAAWGLDDYEYRSEIADQSRLAQAEHIVAQRPPFRQSNAMLERCTAGLREALGKHADRTDLLDEMAGLSWSLGIVDIRTLLAFQRRLFFRANAPTPAAPTPQDWPALFTLCLGSHRTPTYETEYDEETSTLTLQSTDPSLHIRITGDASIPLSVHTSGPFFEVACFRGRWFLRDGYHRAYTLLQAGIFEVPAIIVHARSLAELGATHPWFFPEEVLFSSTPPLVADFLADHLVLTYTRPQLVKTLRIALEETLTPAPGELP
jgi:hypothetical protein